MELLHLLEADLLAPIDFSVGDGQFGLHGRIIPRGQMSQIGGKKKAGLRMSCDQRGLGVRCGT